MSDEVSLRGMRFHALVGILPHERELRQPLEVDLTLSMATAIASGELHPESRIVDYRTLYDLVAEEVTGGHVGYIEHVATRIADRVLADSRIARVAITVRKPHVALPGPLACAEVRVERTRGG